MFMHPKDGSPNVMLESYSHSDIPCVLTRCIELERCHCVKTGTSSWGPQYFQNTAFPSTSCVVRLKEADHSGRCRAQRPALRVAKVVLYPNCTFVCTQPFSCHILLRAPFPLSFIDMTTVSRPSNPRPLRQAVRQSYAKTLNQV
ncbi:hypothetical protein LIA77_06148 [Sarocladium implicatum]|nr:hypothetical protein LIA77_06148 [Sarocladium implicatum]